MNSINRVLSFVVPLLKKRIVLLVLLLVAGIVALVYFGVIQNPVPNVPLFQKGPKVDIKTEYKNPFDKKTQYVNPFETYKNPFVVAK